MSEPMPIGEVAALSGVSRATVSRVLNGGQGVSPATIRRVQDAIDELGYSRSHTRRGRRTKQSAGFRHRTVALLLVRTEVTMLSAPIGGLVLNVIESELAAIGVSLVVSKVNEAGDLPAAVLDNRIDGLLLLGFSPDAELSAVIANRPSVWLLSQRDAAGYVGSRVSPDNHRVGELAARYLIDRGYQSLVYLDTEPGHSGFGERRTAFERAAHDVGGHCAVVSAHEPIGSTVTREAGQRLKPLIERVRNDIRGRIGIFVPRDPAMVLVHRLLKQQGADLASGEIGLISCDNDPVLAGLDPLPATIDLNTGAIAHTAVQVLADLVNGVSPAGMRQHVYIEPTLVPPEGQPTFTGTQPVPGSTTHD
ncbi:MAG: LacI family DNA-binding transcriptional regulator [Planctomycetota bacterium]